MQTKTTKATGGLKSFISNKKVLMLNGYPVVQACALNEYVKGSMFLDENVLLFVIQGTLKIWYGKIEFEVKKDQMAFLKKDIVIEYESLSQGICFEKVEYILFSLKYELVKEFTTVAELSIAVNENTSVLSVNALDIRLLKYIDSLEPYFFEPEKVKANLVKIKLLELLFYIAGMNNKVLEQLLDLKEQFRHNITTTVEENIMNSISLNQLAVLSGRSLSGFRRDFLAIYNMPPSEWIRQKRLSKARELLLSTTMTITDICYTSGFESIAHFSRLFKLRFGNSPSGFRMNVLVA